MSGCLHNVLYLKDEQMDVVTEQVWVTVSASRAHVLAVVRSPPAGAQADLGYVRLCKHRCSSKQKGCASCS